MIKGDNFVLACSGGPDSMALFHMLWKQKKNFVCAHVNYHLREEAEQESQMLEAYCLVKGIPFYRKDAFYIAGNMESWAREVRYTFFEEIAKKTGFSTILVAHHQDDLLETYYLQKEKKGCYDYWGLAEIRSFGSLTIYRPLLNQKKTNLLAYCQEKDIPYSIDFSNQDLRYRRNFMRKKISCLSEEQRQEILREIQQRNFAQLQEEQACDEFLSTHSSFLYQDFIKFPYRHRLLRKLLYKNLSATYLEEILRQLQGKKVLLKVRKKIISKQYGICEIIEPHKDYEIIFEKLRFGKFKYFTLTKHGKRIEGVYVKEEDFPICIRNVREGDSILLRYGHKNVHRFLIDRKILFSERQSWPVIENSKGKIIFVAGIGCDKYHYSDSLNLFLIK